LQQYTVSHSISTH